MKCTEGTGDKCLYAKEAKCTCECNGDNHGRQLEMFTESEGGENMTYRITIVEEGMLRKALTALLADFREAIEKGNDFSTDQAVEEAIDIFKQFGE